MTESQQRIMRIPLPVPLIREMDAVIIKGLGGYTTRAEFIVDAIQERVLELSIAGVEDAGPPPANLRYLEQGVAAPSPVQATSSAATVQMTAIVVPSSGHIVTVDDDLTQPESKSLFGLHNRDYPSLWALAQLAALTAEHPIPVETFYDQVTAEAWKFGELLAAIEKHTGIKRTALFPTNAEKRKSAETGFRAFAIGDYRGGHGNAFITSGPLFEWRAAALVAGDPKEPLIGVTAAGWSLLKALEGISVEEPHPAQASAHFLAHLLEHAPADHGGFIEIVRAIGTDGATRHDVLDYVVSAWPDWTENEVSTNSAGYIARAREWGLVEPKQTKTKYHLTPLGIEVANGAN